MEVDASPPAAPIDLAILATVRSARARHGLRTNDYGRYRCVCGEGRTRAHVPALIQTHATPSIAVFFSRALSTLSLLSSYCTKKLRRLYRNLKLSHGRGKYQKRVLDAGTVTEEGCVFFFFG